jgi:hypothetical protein
MLTDSAYRRERQQKTRNKEVQHERAKPRGPELERR